MFYFSCENPDGLKLIVGSEPYRETIFVEETALAAVSPVFRAMLSTPLSEQQTKMIKIEEADMRSVEVLLDLCGVLRLPGTRINSVETAVGLLWLGQKYLIGEVEVPALLYLQQHLSLHTALYVLQHLHVLYNQFSGITSFIIQVFKLPSQSLLLNVSQFSTFILFAGLLLLDRQQCPGYPGD